MKIFRHMPIKLSMSVFICLPLSICSNNPRNTKRISLQLILGNTNLLQFGDMQRTLYLKNYRSFACTKLPNYSETGKYLEQTS